jgi:hypothetical protein
MGTRAWNPSEPSGVGVFDWLVPLTVFPSPVERE